MISAFVSRVASIRSGLEARVRAVRWITPSLVSCSMDGPGGHWCQNNPAGCHRSNWAYYTVDLEKGSVVQRCYDVADCGEYRSPPSPVDEPVLAAFRMARLS